MEGTLQIEASYRQILRTALPISVALLMPQANFIINSIFLARLGEQVLAVATITGVYYLIFSGIGYGLNNGLQTLISRRAGENRPHAIGPLFQQGILIAMLVAGLGICTTYFIAPMVLRATLNDPEIYASAISFLKVRIWGLPFLYIYQMRNALLVGTNQSRYLVPGTVAEAITNIVLDYLLIFGLGSWAGLGFEGAAYASIVAEFTGMFVIFLVIRRKRMHKAFALFATPRPDAVLVRSIARISAPLVFQYAISIVSWLFFYILIERNTNETSMAVSNTMRNIIGFFGVFSWAFAATASSMVSNLIGQGKNDQVLPLIAKVVKLGAGFSLLVCLLLNLFPVAYFSLYGLPTTFAAAGIPVLRLVAVAMVLMSIATVWLNGVTGTGKSGVTFGIEMIAIILYCAYTYVVLEHLQLSIFWGWASELLYWTCLYLLSFLYLKSARWHRASL